MSTQIWDPGNGVKPRFDGEGSEFGKLHRLLGSGYYMFDIDKMTADVNISLELERADTGFVEYRIVGDKVVTFTAMFEVKYARTEKSEQALLSKNANTMAMIEIARRLDCRLFVVFATNGQQPFEFYEWNKLFDEFVFVGRLEYNKGTNPAYAIKTFWQNVLKIYRLPMTEKSDDVG